MGDIIYKKHIIVNEDTNTLLQKVKLKILIKMNKEGKDFKQMSKITDSYAIHEALKSYMEGKP